MKNPSGLNLLSLLAVSLLAGIQNAQAQGVHSNCPSATAAAQLLVGSNPLLNISNAAWARPCDSNTPYTVRISKFDCGHALSRYMPQGSLVLSTGNAVAGTRASNERQKRNTAFSSTAATDADLVALSKVTLSQALYDPAVLTFDIFVRSSGTLVANYLFGSDEYPDYAARASGRGRASATHNDLFGFFASVAGTAPKNYATAPSNYHSSGETTVCTESINAITNAQLFVNNSQCSGLSLDLGNLQVGLQSSTDGLSIIVDGMTKVMRTKGISVQANQTLRVKIAIADGGTNTIDSLVWLPAGSLVYLDCVGSWSTWGACSKSCGGGIQRKTFTVYAPAASGGAPCQWANGTTWQQDCSTQACASNDCVGSWGVWSACSASCGCGTQSSTYTITTKASNAGAACPAGNGQVRTQACNAHVCPINCAGSWSDWSACSAACGGGTQSSMYTVTTPAMFGGTACTVSNGLMRTQACNTQACAVNCVGSWGVWSSCSEACGGGAQNSTYSITTAAANGGAACPATNGQVKSQACNVQPCPVNCTGSWSAWSSCSAASCGGGAQTCTYIVTNQAANGGTACPASNGQVRSQACNTGPCPVDCVGSWGPWSNCSTACGGGTQSSTYTITTPAANGGAACPASNGQVKTQTCNTLLCPIACVGSWSHWSACSAGCGGGTQSSTFSASMQAAFGGLLCPATHGQVRTQACNTQACPPGDCTGSWSDWSPCSAACGGGAQSSTYTITTPATHGGAACPASNGQVRSQACNTQPCPFDCVGSWGPWSACSADCGGGTQSAAYTITTPAANNGTACPASHGQVKNQACNTQACPSVDCLGSWSAWSSCSAPSCGGGTQTSTYTVATQAANGGTACPASSGQVKVQACNTQRCPVDCAGSWSEFGTCSQSCGGGTQTSTYSVTSEAAFGGATCPASHGQVKSQPCNAQPCAVNCQGIWGEYGACSAACEGGEKTATYTVTTPAAHGGAACPASDGQQRTQACNTQPCPVDCAGSWGEFGACSAVCGGATRSSTYSITTPAANGGATCSATDGQVRTESCITQACPSGDCTGSWGPWSACDASCEGGNQSSTYTVTAPATHGGAACPTADGEVNTQACNTQPCPVDCAGSWGEFGACSAACGSGTQTATYTVTTQASNGGAACEERDSQTKSQPCSIQRCPPADCQGSWSGFGTCSAACGTGTQIKSYRVTSPASNGGAPCPTPDGQTDAQACNTHPCPVDCVGSWSGYGACSAACGPGTQTQTYSVTTPASNGGVPCPEPDGQTRTRSCHSEPCAEPPSPSPPAGYPHGSGGQSPGPCSCSCQAVSSPSPNYGNGSGNDGSSSSSGSSSSPGSSPSGVDESGPASSPSNPQHPAGQSPSPDASGSAQGGSSGGSNDQQQQVGSGGQQQGGGSAGGSSGGSGQTGSVTSPQPPSGQGSAGGNAGQTYITSGIVIRDGNMSFLTATAGTDKATRLRQHAALRFRSGTLAGQLEFLTQGLSLKLDGSFGISRSLSWTYSPAASSWSTSVDVLGSLLLNAGGFKGPDLPLALTGTLMFDSTTLPGLSGGFSGNYVWRGTLELSPDPFHFWLASGGTAGAPSRRLAAAGAGPVLAATDTADTLQSLAGQPLRALLQAASTTGPQEVQTSTQVQEKPLAAGAAAPGPVVPGSTFIVDDEISVEVPVDYTGPGVQQPSNLQVDAGTDPLRPNSRPDLQVSSNNIGGMTERDKWIIVGVFIALAGILLIVIAVCVFCCLRRRRRRQQQQTIMVLQGQAGQKAAAEKRASDDAADAPVAADELPLPHQLSSASLSNRGRSNAGGGFAQWTITPNDNATVSASQVQVQTASTLRAEVDAARGLWPILLERNVPEGSTTGGGPAGSAQTEWTYYTNWTSEAGSLGDLAGYISGAGAAAAAAGAALNVSGPGLRMRINRMSQAGAPCKGPEAQDGARGLGVVWGQGSGDLTAAAGAQNRDPTLPGMINPASLGGSDLVRPRSPAGGSKSPAASLAAAAAAARAAGNTSPSSPSTPGGAARGAADNPSRSRASPLGQRADAAIKEGLDEPEAPAALSQRQKIMQLIYNKGALHTASSSSPSRSPREQAGSQPQSPRSAPSFT